MEKRVSNFHNTASKMIAQSPMASVLTLFKVSVNNMGICIMMQKPHSSTVKKTGRYS